MMNFGGPQPQPSRKKFIGVRQRQTGGWVAEIKNTQRTRIWLGTFKTAEGAARAYDEAACSLRGANAITNFSPSSQTLSTKPAVPSKITNLLLRRHEARHNAPLPPTLVTRHAHVAKPSDTYLTDYLCDLDADLPLNDTMACDIDSNMIMSFEARTGIDVDCCSGGGTREEDKEEENKENLGFRFIDEVGSGYGFSPFDIVEETEFAREDKEPLTISEAVKMMKYNRKFSVNAKIPQANVVSEMDTSNDTDSICVVELA